VITDLGHPAFAAHDVDATLRFYRILGIEEAFRLHHDDGALMLVYLHVSGDRFVEVFPGGPPPDPDREQSFEHICLLTDDIHAAVERLRENDAPIDSEPLVGLDGNLASLDARPRRKPDRTDATLRGFSATAGRTLCWRSGKVGR